jgi:hypothetical protein
MNGKRQVKGRNEVGNKNKEVMKGKQMGKQGDVRE